MSLRAFHVVFVVASVLLGVAFCSWAFASARPVIGGAAGFAALALATYCSVFVRRLRREAAND